MNLMNISEKKCKCQCTCLCFGCNNKDHCDSSNCCCIEHCQKKPLLHQCEICLKMVNAGHEEVVHSTLPQELRREEWEEKFMKEFENIITVEYDYLLNVSRPAQDSDPRPKIIAFIKRHVEQKAREEERAKASLCIFNSCSDCQILSERYKTQNHKVVLSNKPKSP